MKTRYARRPILWALLRAWMLTLLIGLGGSALAAPKAGVTEDIRDIHGPVTIPSWWRLAVIAGGGVLTLGLIGAAIRLSRRRRPLTPEEQALKLLDEAKPLADAGKPREYAGAASEAVRWYIEQRFALRAAHSTTEEFLTELAAGPALSARRAALAEFLQACDLAKFASYALPREGMHSLHELARNFVLTATSPQPAQGRVS